jgi:hypothetical protein
MSCLPYDVARCQPTGCKQSADCARANDWPTGDDINLSIVDASVSLTSSQEWCPMFIDMRGADLVAPSKPEKAAVTRTRYSIEDRIAQVAKLLTPAGITTTQIAAALGITTCARTSIILVAAIEAGQAFRTFARVSETKKTPEMVYFPTEADRDRFREAYDIDIKARAKAREARLSRAGYLRNRSPEIAARGAKRAAARALRDAEKAVTASMKEALKLAGAELSKQSKRLAREGKAAERQRGDEREDPQQRRDQAHSPCRRVQVQRVQR